LTEKIGLQAVLETSDFDAGVRSYNAGLDSLVSSSEDASTAAVKQLTSYTDLAQTLSNTGPQQMAATATERLKSSFADGSLSAEQYASAMTQVQDEFGLVSSQGKSAASSLITAEKAFAAGEISAEEYAAELKKVAGEEEKASKSAVELAASMEIVEQAYAQVKEIIGSAMELAELGAQSERVEERFRAFASTIGDADEILLAFQEGAGGTVDKMTAMTSASRLMQMGLVSNADEMGTVVEMATRLGDQTQSAGDRVADFAALLANQSIPRLDNFGISSGKVRDRVEELTTGVNAVSREVAFSQAVFEEGANSLNVLGERADDSAASLERAEAKTKDLQVEVGQKLAPFAAKAADALISMNDGTIALATGLTGALGILVKFSGGLPKLIEHLGTSGIKAGGLGIAIVGLVIAVEFATDKFNKMNAAQEESKAAAADLGNQVSELVAGGMSLADATAVVTQQIQGSTDAWNDANAVQKGAIALLGQGSEFTDAMATATGSLKQAVFDGSSSFAEYSAVIATHNATVTDSKAKITAMTEAQFNNSKRAGEQEAHYEMLAEKAAEYGIVLDDDATALERVAAAMGDTTSATEDLAVATDDLELSARDQLLALEELTGAEKVSAETKQEMLAAAEKSAEAQAHSIAMTEKAAAMTEKAARAQERSETTALAAAAAMEEKRKKDIALAQEEVALAQSVMGASDAMIAQSFISGLDPEAMGLTAYREAVEGIQLTFGLATPESIALAGGITDGIAAANAGELAYKDLDEFILKLREDAADGVVNFDSLSREFASSSASAESLAGRIDDTGDAIDGMVSQTEDLIEVEEGLETQTKQAVDQSRDFGRLVANVGNETELWTDALTGTTKAIDDTQATTAEWASAMQGLDSRLVDTGEDALSVTEKVGALNTTFGRSDDAALEAAGGLDVVDESAGSAALALEGLEGAMDNTAAAATSKGAAIGANLAAGLLPAIHDLVDEFNRMLDEGISGNLPSSEPKNPDSPLRGLGKRGAAIMTNIAQGMTGAAPVVAQAATDAGSAIGEALSNAILAEAAGNEELNALEGLFSAAGVLGGLGGTAAGMLQKGTIRPLEEELRGAENEIDRIRGVMAGVEKERQELMQERASGVSAERELAINERLLQLEKNRRHLHQMWVDTDEDRVEAARKLAEQEERILRLQEAQERLKFLEQQAKLLDLIAEKGLDAEAILGGLELGVDASVEDIIDAMSRAMEAIIAQANEELGIASPSKVFEKIGEETMAGMAMGIKNLMDLPVAQSALATQAMVSAPAMIAGARSTNVDQSRSMGDVNINNPSLPDQAAQDQLLSTIRREIASSLRGVR